MNKVIGGRVEGKHTERRPKILESVGIIRSVQKHAKMYEGAGIELLRLGLNISAQIMSAKMERVLQNVTAAANSYCLTFTVVSA